MGDVGRKPRSSRAAKELCAECKRPMRKAGEKASDRPGTVARSSASRCRSCAAKARQTAQVDEPAVPTTGDKLRAMITGQTDARTLGLLIEAGRIADRLDDLDKIIAGKGVLDLLRFRLVDLEGRVAEVKFDGVLAEARQQASAFKALLAQLGVPKLEVIVEKRSGVDQLRERRAARAAERTAEAAGSAPS